MKMMAESRVLDPVTLEIMWNRLISVADEQAKALIRSSFSTVASEMEDLACALYDSQGRLISQAATGVQGILIGMMRGMAHILRKYPVDCLKPGDVIVGNDPWIFSGHKYDITVATPVFYKGKLAGLAANILHASDIGGISSPGDATDVYNEGLEIPILKLFKAGEPNQELLEVIQSNVRVPDQVIGDLMAQVSANEVAGRRLVEFLEENRLESLLPLSQAIICRTREAVRQEIEALPDGIYTNQVNLDGVDGPLTIKVSIRIEGPEMTVDFGGTSPQTERGGINAVYNFTLAWTCHALKSVLVPALPNNEGLFNSFKLVAPEGCLVNCQPPAPVMARYVVAVFISAAVMGALAKVAPDRVVADSGSGFMTLVSGYWPDGRRFVHWLGGWGGMGARPNKDGISGTSYPANIGNVSLELIENVSPLFVLERELVQDSGGPGKYRGGCAQKATMMVRGGRPAVIHTFYERTKHPAKGYFGGQEGCCGAFVINDTLRPHPKEKYLLTPGQTFSFCHPSGGGMFSPLERDPQLVLMDVINGYLSVQGAADKYKLVVDKDNRAIDWEQTQRLRQSLARG